MTKLLDFWFNNYSIIDIILETGIHKNVDKPPASISSLSGQLKRTGTEE